MSIYLSHQSALAYWTFNADASSEDMRHAKVHAITDSCAAAAELADLELLGLGVMERPFHVLVNRPENRHRSSLAETHLWTGAVNDCCFACLRAGAYVSTPEFALLQMAVKLDHVELAWIASLLCSDFRYVCHEAIPKSCEFSENQRVASPSAADDDPGFVKAERLTSLHEMEMFARHMAGAQGSTKLRKALSHAIEGARSPMELAIGLMFSLPRRLGGYGFRPLGLNVPIRLSTHASALCGARILHPDLLFPNKVIAEYDSFSHHTGRQKLAGDRARYNAFIAMGYTPIGLTAESVHDIEALDAHYLEIVKATKKLVRPPTKSPWEREQLLMKLLNRHQSTLAKMLGE